MDVYSLLQVTDTSMFAENEENIKKGLHAVLFGHPDENDILVYHFVSEKSRTPQFKHTSDNVLRDLYIQNTSQYMLGRPNTYNFHGIESSKYFLVEGSKHIYRFCVKTDELLYYVYCNHEINGGNESEVNIYIYERAIYEKYKSDIFPS